MSSFKQNVLNFFNLALISLRPNFEDLLVTIDAKQFRRSEQKICIRFAIPRQEIRNSLELEKFLKKVGRIGFRLASETEKEKFPKDSALNKYAVVTMNDDGKAVINKQDREKPWLLAVIKK